MGLTESSQWVRRGKKHKRSFEAIFAELLKAQVADKH